MASNDLILKEWKVKLEVRLNVQANWLVSLPHFMDEETRISLINLWEHRGRIQTPINMILKPVHYSLGIGFPHPSLTATWVMSIIN